MPRAVTQQLMDQVIYFNKQNPGISAQALSKQFKVTPATIMMVLQSNPPTVEAYRAIKERKYYSFTKALKKDKSLSNEGYLASEAIKELTMAFEGKYQDLSYQIAHLTKISERLCKHLGISTN